MILEGWRDAIWAGQYAAVKYDCASAAAVAKIRRIANRAQFSAPEFIAAAQRSAEETWLIGPDPEVDEPAPTALATVKAEEVAVDDRSDERQLQLAPPPARPATIAEPPASPPKPEESLEAAAERERRYREIMGIAEPRQRRRWRR